MKILLVLGHPEAGSFNHAIAERAHSVLNRNGHEVFFHDLYTEGFDPLLPAGEIPKNGVTDQEVDIHCEQLQACGGIVIVHPNWWGQPPAVVKGWIDRIFRPGVAYEFEEGDNGEGIPVGLLRGKRAAVFNTSNTSAEREARVFGDPLENLWETCIFKFCGIDTFYRRMFSVVVSSTEEDRRLWLDEVENSVKGFFC